MIEAETSETVPFYDTDCGGVVSNIAYLRYIEKARTLLFAGLGMPASDMMESGLFPAVVRTEIDYRAAARLADEIRVTARIIAVDKVRVSCSFELTARSKEGEPRPVASALQVVALVQLPEGRPRRIPAEWFKLIE